MPTIDYKVIENFLTLFAKNTNAKNISVSLSLQGERYFWETAAPQPEPTRFQIGCITNALLAAIVLELDESGLLDIEQSIGEYLNEFLGTPIGEQVLIRQLLSDTSGYVGFPFFNSTTADMTWEGLTMALAVEPLLFTPGTVCSHDHASKVLMAEIVKRISGRLWLDHVDEKVGKPLFGRSLYTEQDREKLWAPSAASTTLSSRDLSDLGEVLMTGESMSCGRVLSERTVSRLQDEVVRIPRLTGGRRVHWLPVGYGLGIPVYHSGLRGECGKGVADRSSVHFSAHMGIVLAVCIDGGGPATRNDVVDAMLAELGIGLPPQADRVPMNVALADLPGDYVGVRGVRVRVDVEGRKVLVAMQGAVAEAKCVCTCHEDGTFSMEKGTSGPSVVGTAFFEDPQTKTPSLMIGVHALRKLK